MKHLGIKENDNIRLTTDHGTVVVKAIKSLRAPHPKTVFVPYGPWASIIMDPQTHGTGMPSLKGIKALIEPAQADQVLQLRGLLEQHYRKQ